MTPENFCYWLKGIFEIQEAGLDKNEKRSIKLTDAQLAIINEHLGYVFQSKAVVNHPPVDLMSGLITHVSDGSGTKIC